MRAWFEETPESTIVVDGVVRSRKNSINEELDSSDSAIESFWRWFGDSKAVDGAGRPVLTYHGTRRQFDGFTASAPRGAVGNPAGVYFTHDRRVAEQYAEDCDGAIDERSKIIAAYLRIGKDTEGLVVDHAYSGREYVIFDTSCIVIAAHLSAGDIHSMACLEVARRFDIPAKAVHEIATIPPDTLVDRMLEKYKAGVCQIDQPVCEKHFELGAVRMNEFGGEHDNRYVDYVQCFHSADLINAEAEQGIKKTRAYATYLEWAKAGHRPPYISVFETDSGILQSTNRRRTLVAQELGVPIYGWLSRINPETGNGLKYGDVIEAFLEAKVALQSNAELDSTRSRRLRP